MLQLPKFRSALLTVDSVHTPTTRARGAIAVNRNELAEIERALGAIFVISFMTQITITAPDAARSVVRSHSRA
jgi:hypothetical protein